MKKLKILLQSNYFYVGFFLLTVIYCCFYFTVIRHSKLKIESNTYQGIIVEIESEGDLLKLELRGKEKIVGNYFFKTEEEKIEFLKKYQLGDSVLLKGTFTLPKKNTVPNLFNYQKYLNRKNIYYVMQVDYIEKIKDNEKILYKVKNWVLNHIENYESKAYLKTFILGNKNLLDEKIVEVYQENGVSHLFALSGMHVSLLSGILLVLLKKLHIKEKNSYLAVILFLLGYMLLSGCSPSICRAVILFGLLGLNRILNLNIKTIFLFLFTFCILVVINPNFLFDVGFQYSFTISFFLLLMQKKFSHSKSYWKNLFFISLLSFIASFPISIFYFYQINLSSILLNLVFVPLVSIIIFPLSLLTFLFPFLDSIFFVITNLMEQFAFFFHDFFLFKIIWGKPNILWILLYYCFLTLFLCFRKRMFLFCLVGLLCYQYFYLILFPKAFFLMIDVGQGDSLLIHSNNQTLLLDTGGKITYKKEKWQSRNTKSLAETTLLPLLKSLGIRKLDYLVISHGDYDHMGEAIHLVNSFKVKKIIFNCGEYNDLEKKFINVLDNKKIPYYRCIKELNINDNKLYFLNHGNYGNENDNSNVIYTKFHHYKFLFMGDAGVETEEDLLEKYNLNDIDVLKVGHHGSKTSSSQYFINAVNPKYSVISVGKNNRYNHPNKEVLKNLENSKVYRTDINGSIMFTMKKDKLKLETFAP